MSDTTRPPDILLVICDDLAWGDLSCHGNPIVQTPQLDRLRDQSTRLTRYCSGPLCTPARAALMTGRHPYRTRAIDTYLGRSMIDPDEMTLARLLQQHGYRTGIFGKWHLGDCYPCRAIDMGFDEALVHAAGGLRQPGCPTPNNGYFDADLSHNGQIVRTTGYCTDVFTDAAIAFLEQPGEQPCFTYLAYNAPHTPLEIAEQWVQPFRDRHPDLPETWARLYALVANVDWNLGRVFEHLAASGRADDTLVVFTSDHGPCPSTRHEGRSRYNAALRGIKGEMYEGGIRVPSFWHWPGHTRPGHDVDRLANPIDMLPTLAAAAGVALPDDRTIDGLNLLPLLEQHTAPADWPDRAIPMQWHRGDEPVRGRNCAVLTQRYKLYQPAEDQPAELYDLADDPYEQTDLANQQPEIVGQLQAQYEQWFDDVSATRPDNYAPPRIHVGSEKEPWTALTRQDWRTVTGEGWSDEHEGYWLLHIESAQPYRVTVHVPPQQGSAVLHVRMAETQLTAPLLPGSRVCTFDAVKLPTGDQRLDAWITTHSARRGVRQIDLHASRA